MGNPVGFHNATNLSLNVVLNVAKMKLSKHNIHTFLLSANQKIEENAEFVSVKIDQGGEMDFVTYPPNCGFTEQENLSLEKLKNDPHLKSALRKILADNSAGVLFDLFNILDGTS
jgi:hypothetical protein